MRTATNDAALSANVQVRPAVAMRMPATAGPTIRDALTMTLFRPTALARSSPPTISMAKLCRDGLSNTLMKPMAKASDQTIHSWTTPVATSRNMTRACAMKNACVAMRTRRLSNRSAMRPP